MPSKQAKRRAPPRNRHNCGCLLPAQCWIFDAQCNVNARGVDKVPRFAAKALCVAQQISKVLAFIVGITSFARATCSSLPNSFGERRNSPLRCDANLWNRRVERIRFVRVRISSTQWRQHPQQCRLRGATDWSRGHACQRIQSTSCS
eukprot:4020829-Pleurochrysis_carterae.AAC.3